jgi:proteasome accessory factor A
MDARGFSVGERLDPEIDYQLVNRVLTNGARYYVDHAHPEYSSPECVTAMDALLYDLAGEAILRRSMVLTRDLLAEQGAEIVVYKNNSDGKGNSYGCHENYLVSRSLPFSDIVRHMTVHFVSRQIFTGSGKLGSENGMSGGPNSFQISQRSDFFEEEVGLETTLRRPIINTRDEPHAEASKFRRLHVIVGDANMSQTATYLKIGTTQILLSMLEDGALPPDLVLDEPLGAIRSVSRDLDLNQSIRLQSGRLTTALNIQFQYLEAAEGWIQVDAVNDKIDQDRRLIVRLWREVLEGLTGDRFGLADRVDWLAKLKMIEGFRMRHDLSPEDSRLKAIDLQYHDLREDRGLAYRAGLRRLVDESSVSKAMVNPPSDTRAFLRGEVLRRWPEQVVSANWDSVVFDVGSGSLVRLPMDDPAWGTKMDVGLVLEECSDLNDLLTRISTSATMSGT